MAQVNEIFAENITRIRTENHLTQFEFGEKLNYSDKAVSRWERGEAIPDARVLVQISEMYNVSIDDLLKTKIEKPTKKDNFINNRRLISIISFFGTWTIALLVFLILYFCGVKKSAITFLYAVPVSLIVALIFNSIWGKKPFRAVIVSLLSWSILATIYFTFRIMNFYLIFMLGIPIQIIIILCFLIKRR